MASGSTRSKNGLALYKSMVSLNEANSQCMDCHSSQPPSHASTNNGVFICQSCAEIHKLELPEKASSVKSLTEEDLTSSELQKMLASGNQRFHDFLKEYKLEHGVEIRLKYMT